MLRYQLTSIFWYPFNIFRDPYNVKVIVIQFLTLLLPGVRSSHWTIVGIARFVVFSLTHTVLSPIRRFWTIALACHGMNTTTTRSTAFAIPAKIDMFASCRNLIDQVNVNLTIHSRAPRAPTTIHRLQGTPIPMHAFCLLTPLMFATFSSVRPWHRLCPTSLHICISCCTPQGAADGLHDTENTENCEIME